MLFYCKSISCEFQPLLDLRFLVSNTFLYVLHLVLFWDFLENFLTHTDIQGHDLFCNFSLVFTFGTHSFYIKRKNSRNVNILGTVKYSDNTL